MCQPAAAVTHFSDHKKRPKVSQDSAKQRYGPHLPLASFAEKLYAKPEQYFQGNKER